MASASKQTAVKAKSARKVNKPAQVLSLSHPLVRECRMTVQRALDGKAAMQKLAQTADDKQDVKLLQSRLAQYDAQVSLARSALVKITGNKPLRITLPVSFTMSTNSSGLLTAVLNVDPTAAVEFTTLAALFDEYKCLGGQLRFNITAVSPSYSGTAPSADNCMAVVAFDPAEGAPLTSVRNGTELAHHKLYGTMATNNATGVSYSSFKHDPLSFQYRVPSGITEGVVSNVQYLTGGGWYPTISTATTMYWGYIKTYTQTSYTAATVAVAGVHYYDLEFRCRT